MITDLLKQLQILSAKNPRVPTLAEVAMAAPDAREEESLKEDLQDLKQLLTPLPKVVQ